MGVLAEAMVIVLGYRDGMPEVTWLLRACQRRGNIKVEPGLEVVALFTGVAKTSEFEMTIKSGRG